MIRKKIFSGVSKSGLKVNVYITDVYPFLIETEKDNKTDQVGVFSVESVVGYLQNIGLKEEFMKAIDDKKEKIKEDVKERSGINIDLIDSLYDNPYITRMMFNTPLLGDRVRHKSVPSRYGKVIAIEYLTISKVPVYFVEWDDGERTIEIPYSLIVVKEGNDG